MPPVTRALPYAADALSRFAPLAGVEGAVLLHSADRSTRFGRYDIMSAQPRRILCAQPRRTLCAQSGHTLKTPAGPELGSGLPLNLSAALEAEFGPTGRWSQGTDSAPFRFGFLGYLGYPLHQALERQRAAPPAPDDLPTLWGGLYDWSVVTDHRHRTTRLHALSDGAAARADALLSRTAKSMGGSLSVGPFEASLSTSGYRQAFDRILDYIHAGDCYQINFARHYHGAFRGDPFLLYQQWLERQCAPFCAYLRLDAERTLLSLSPERFLKRRGQRVWVCPIKGTRPRRDRPERDQLSKLALLRSAKDRAENLMIVDLLRNDLGRLALPGSVQVTHLFEPFAFRNVHHLVSTIEGELRTDTSSQALLEALFPCGSVTGAPKIRAVDIINELEPVGRSVYCGAVGYLDAGGDCDFNVAIRTATISDNRVHLWGGGGIVADSKPASEREEIRSKIGRLMAVR